MRTLRLSAPITRSLMDSFPAPTLVSLVCAHAAETLRRAGSLFKARHHWLVRLVECRISQVSGESIPYVCPALRPRSVQLASPYRPAQCCPHCRENEDTNVVDNLEAPSRGFRIHTYASRDELPHPKQGSLPAGGCPLPGGSRTPWTPIKGFRLLHLTSSFARLFLALPGVISAILV